MNKTYIKEMIKLLETAYNDLKDSKAGCHYLPLEDDLYLVVGYDEEGQEVVAKVAYNCDDLQSDYTWDWFFPMYEEDDCDDCDDCWCTEIAIDGKHFKEDAEWFYNVCKDVIQEREKGTVADWRT